MLRFVAHPLSRVFMLLAAAVWLASTSASSVHHLVVKHVVCTEHGELSEVRGTPATSAADHPSIVAGEAEDPDHGCTGVAQLPDRAPPVLGSPRISRAPLLLTARLTTPAAPRGPPLDYAPKTSPPVAIG